MKTLLKNAMVVNVFTETVEKKDILIEDNKITGVGKYESDADITEDLSGRYVCPGFIDSHIHIESTMMTPNEFSKTVLPHGTTAVVTDPHEIANVCGVDGIKYIFKMSEELPLDIYVMLPSCVPSTANDESGAVLKASDLEPLYEEKRVLGLAEMMNYPGVLFGDSDVLKKIEDARKRGLAVDGHAPMLSGADLDKYISAGIMSDHECSNFSEALEKLQKGQWIMIRQGTAAKNLEDLIDLFDEPWSRRCLLATDDKHPQDFFRDGHIDGIIKKAVELGKSPVTGIRLATIQAAEYFKLPEVGAIAPGYRADLLVLDDLDTVKVRDVYKNGQKVVKDCEILKKTEVKKDAELERIVKNTFRLRKLNSEDFYIKPEGEDCRVIKVIPRQIITDEEIVKINFEKNNGIDTDRDILKIAVVERHHNTGHMGVGYITGIGMKKGALCSSVSHDSHNIIVIGTNDADMAAAVNKVAEFGGGYAAVSDGEVLAALPLPVAGLMSEASAEEITELNVRLNQVISSLGVLEDIEPLMHMAFVSLTVIPNLKLSTRGLVDVNTQQIVSLFKN